MTGSWKWWESIEKNELVETNMGTQMLKMLHYGILFMNFPVFFNLRPCYLLKFLNHAGEECLTKVISTHTLLLPMARNWRYRLLIMWIETYESLSKIRDSFSYWTWLPWINMDIILLQKWGLYQNQKKGGKRRRKRKIKVISIHVGNLVLDSFNPLLPLQWFYDHLRRTACSVFWNERYYR